MKVEIKAPEPFISVMKKTNELAAFTNFWSCHQTLEPTDANLDALIWLEYPKCLDNVIPTVKYHFNSKAKGSLYCSQKSLQNTRSFSLSALQIRGKMIWKILNQNKNFAGLLL